MSTSAGPDIIEDGLVLCLDAADPKSYNGSGTTWYDRSVNKAECTMSGGPVVVNVNAGVLFFENQSDSLIGPTAAELGIPDDGLTIEVWLKKIEDYPSSNSQGFGGFTSINIKNTVNFFCDNFSDSNGRTLIIFTPNVFEWVHLTITYDGNVLKTYANGEYSGNQRTFTLRSIQSENFYIAGMGYYRPHAYFAAYRLYNRGLSDAEVKQNYNATKSRFQL
jgi:hypothetical protein